MACDEDNGRSTVTRNHMTDSVLPASLAQVAPFLEVCPRGVAVAGCPRWPTLRHMHASFCSATHIRSGHFFLPSLWCFIMFFIIRTVASTGGQVGKKKKKSLSDWILVRVPSTNKSRGCSIFFFSNGSVSKAANFSRSSPDLARIS